MHFVITRAREAPVLALAMAAGQQIAMQPYGIDFLVNALGFEKQAVYEGPDGLVMHAQLTFGGGMLMLGSADNGGEASKHMVLPSEIVYEQAKAAGAVIVQELVEMEYGGKAFACVDPEGYRWSVGEYDPWA